jgi:hypothetical protein
MACEFFLRSFYKPNYLFQILKRILTFGIGSDGLHVNCQVLQRV